jgi:1,4-alpha-glucan branching enzyme
MIHKEASKSQGKVFVTFELPSSIWAEKANLVGEFNDWSRTQTPMFQSKIDGAWRVTIELDADRDYQFRYLIDGETWYTDYFADSYVANEYGSDNSVVHTAPPPPPAAGEPAARASRRKR